MTDTQQAVVSRLDEYANLAAQDAPEGEFPPSDPFVGRIVGNPRIDQREVTNDQGIKELRETVVILVDPVCIAVTSQDGYRRAAWPIPKKDARRQSIYKSAALALSQVMEKAGHAPGTWSWDTHLAGKVFIWHDIPKKDLDLSPWAKERAKGTALIPIDVAPADYKQYIPPDIMQLKADGINKWKAKQVDAEAGKQVVAIPVSSVSPNGASTQLAGTVDLQEKADLIVAYLDGKARPKGTVDTYRFFQAAEPWFKQAMQEAGLLDKLMKGELVGQLLASGKLTIEDDTYKMVQA